MCFQAVYTKVDGSEGFGINSQLALNSNFLFPWNVSMCGKGILPSIIKIELRTSKVCAEGESFDDIGPSLTLILLWGRGEECSSQVVLPGADGVCLLPTLSLLTAHW